ncbi:uncharacterized protein LOC122794328 isoform X2 [Protopterus annectens]|uniref:uncharacterized protein LOC122794328 isoform X2 n=1 Tax=Protopterus annectens TaxID=7888 RepID=UPI001CFA75F8|nr:uncharacterized protein LOC122794328 isoform X2 [Protopterus annectens]
MVKSVALYVFLLLMGCKSSFSEMAFSSDSDLLVKKSIATEDLTPELQRSKHSADMNDFLFAEYEIYIEMPPSMLNKLKQMIENGTFPITIQIPGNTEANMTSLEINAVCTIIDNETQCTCEQEYIWNSNICDEYQSCSGSAGENCKCIRQIPLDGTCESVENPTEPAESDSVVYDIYVQTKHGMLEEIKRGLREITFPFLLNTPDDFKANISSLEITTVCSTMNTLTQCTCESGYIWDSQMCDNYGRCSNETEGNCNCVRSIPSNGSCEHVVETGTATTPPVPGIPDSVIYDIYVQTKHGMLEEIKRGLSEIAFPFSLNTPDEFKANISSLEITTVCSTMNTLTQCTCESGYIWDSQMCDYYGRCSNETEGNCNCVRNIPSNGSCEHVVETGKTTTPPVPGVPGMFEYELHIDLPPKHLVVLRSFLNNVSVPLRINRLLTPGFAADITYLNLTAVCTLVNSETLCTCETGYIWSSEMCNIYGRCSNQTEGSCGCVRNIPSNGTCEQVSISGTIPTTSPIPGIQGMFEYELQIDLPPKHQLALRSFLNNVSVPLNISRLLTPGFAADITYFNLTAVCTLVNSETLCTCETGYIWSSEMCNIYGRCSNQTEGSCGCVRNIPSNGTCEPVSKTGTMPTTSPKPGIQGMFEYELHIELPLKHLLVLRSFLNNVSIPHRISRLLTPGFAADITYLNLTAVCTELENQMQCTCEYGYIWNSQMCRRYHSCSNTTKDNCNCIRNIPINGTCEQLDEQSITEWTTTRQTLTTISTTGVTITSKNSITETDRTGTSPKALTMQSVSSDKTRITRTTPRILPSTITETDKTTSHVKRMLTGTTRAPFFFSSFIPPERPTPQTTTKISTRASESASSNSATTYVSTSESPSIKSTTWCTKKSVPTSESTSENTTFSAATTSMPNPEPKPLNTTSQSTARFVPTSESTSINITSRSATTSLPTSVSPSIKTTSRSTKTSVPTSESTSRNILVSAATTYMQIPEPIPLNTTSQSAATSVSLSESISINAVSSSAIASAQTSKSISVNVESSSSTKSLLAMEPVSINTTARSATTAVPTSESALQLITSRPARAKYAMNITTDMQFTEDLQNSNSFTYKLHKGHFEQALSQTYSSQPGFEAVGVNGFYSGSVRVDAEVVTAPIDEATLDSSIITLKNVLRNNYSYNVLSVSVFAEGNVSIIPSSQITSMGEILTLKCVLDGLEHPQTVKWTLNNKRVIPNGPILNHIVRRDMNGTYMCQLHENYLMANPSQPVTITVYSLPSGIIVYNQTLVCGGNSGAAMHVIKCCINKGDSTNYTVTLKTQLGSLSGIQTDEDGKWCYNFTHQSLQCKTETASCAFKNLAGGEKSKNLTISYINQTDVSCNNPVGKNDASILWYCPGDQVGDVNMTCTDGKWVILSSYCVSAQLRAVYEYAVSLNDSILTLDEVIPIVLQNLAYIVEQNAANFTETNNIQEVVKILNIISTFNITAVDISTMKNIIISLDAILGSNSLNNWLIVIEQRRNITLELLSSMERFAQLLSFETQTISINTSNVELKGTNLSKANTTDNYKKIFYENNFVEIPGKELRNVSLVVSIGYKTLANILTINASNTMANATINGIVISTTATGSISNVTLTFHKSNLSLNLPICVFVNYAEGEWSSAGCNGSNHNDSVTCMCDHLTPFSVLMSLQPQLSTKKDAFLEWITYIGVGISIGCLVICLIIESLVWQSVAKSRQMHMKHVCIVNIALSLLVADIWFIVGAAVQHSSPACKAATFFTHFFYLSLFFWVMIMAAVLLYLNLLVFPNISKSGMLIASFPVGYGCPLIIAIITIAVTEPQGYYIKDNACWLDWNNSKAILAFAIPALIIIFINLMILFMIIIKALRPATGERMNLEDRSIVLQTATSLIFLTPLLGLTWGFGIATAIYPSSVTFQVIFTVLNAFQGFFILVIGTLMDGKVCKALLRRLSLGRWASQEISIPRTDTGTFGSPLSRATENFRKNRRSLPSGSEYRSGNYSTLYES